MRRCKRWLWLLSALAAAQAIAVEVAHVDDELSVEWEYQHLAADGRVATYRGNVKATYGPTTLFADELVLELDAKRGHATGNVRLEDPDGRLAADAFRFDWGERTGSAENVTVHAANVMIRAGSIEVRPDRWRVTDAYITPCAGERVPFLGVFSREVVLRSGRGGRARAPDLEIFGRRVLRIPVESFSLDRRVTGFRFPGVSFRRGQGIGLTWASSFLLDDRTAFSGTFAKFEGKPSYGAQVSWSSVAPTRSSGLVAPRTELAERFGEGYFDVVAVDEPEDEVGYLGAERSSVSAGSTWNQSTAGRPVDSADVTKRLELALEQGGEVAGIVGFVQVRAQEVRETSSTPFVRRVLALASASTRPIALGPNLSARLRVDAYATRGGRPFGWVRAMPSLLYDFGRGWRAGVAYGWGHEFGDPDFGYDGLLSKRGLHMRLDGDLGFVKASLLLKHDRELGGVYDREYSLRFPIGCVEPFVVVRTRPSDTRFGVRIDIDRLLSRLQQRELKRQPSR